MSALASALEELITRHEILRTTFVEFDGEPRQVVTDHSSLTLRPEHFSGVAALERALQPHILNDAWSMDVVHRELSALYDAALVGKAAPLPPIDVHYADFAEMLGRS